MHPPLSAVTLEYPPKQADEIPLRATSHGHPSPLSSDLTDSDLALIGHLTNISAAVGLP